MHVGMNKSPTAPPPDEALPFAPEEFAAVYDLVARASRLIRARRAAGLDFKGADDAVAAGRARGAILADAFAPVRERYKGDAEKYHGAVHRMTALAKLIRGSTINEWLTVTGDGVAVHKAVLHTAAIMPLTREGEFSPGEFIEEVKRRVGGAPPRERQQAE
jgi:hypothetical protein